MTIMRWCSGDLKLSPLLWTLQPEQQVGTVTGGDTDTELFLERRLFILGDRSLPGLTAARSINNGICDDDNIF